ncbi:MAG: glycogen/starch/alpha-glucan phosphorylase [Spirochaetales bacterium]|nr:glycogen/starch/alpha-glucan phosphorylase [Spirochaetales bacterium]
MANKEKDKDKEFISLSRQGCDEDSLMWGFAEHLRFTCGVDRFIATPHDKYLSMAYTIRDRIINRWLATQQAHYKSDTKRVYYMSLEFLMGRAMGNNVINLELEDVVKEVLTDFGYNWEELREEEQDAGLGNGGLGRLAACFLDSMASLDIPAYGYGLRYDYGIFRQEIINGHQVEQPDEWLRKGNPWEIERSDMEIEVQFGGYVEQVHIAGKVQHNWIGAEKVIGIAYDTPVVGFKGTTVNTLRLWSSKAGEEFNFGEFNEGDYVEAVKDKVLAENLTKVLYPNDKLYLGKELRFKQQYFFVACSLWDIVRRFKKANKPWKEFPNMAAIQLNDTHPSLAIPELMRILIDFEHLSWDAAWDIVVKTFGYTNHTLMPEALEKWPVHMFEKVLPRHLQIVYEINHRFLEKICIHYPANPEKLKSMSIIEEGPEKQVRMANLCIVGSHSTNGVAAIHTELLKSRLVPEFAEYFPERFNNKTNGITQRRWLLKANPPLADLITETIGDSWITDMPKLQKLKKFSTDKEFVEKFAAVKQQNKQKFSDYLQKYNGFSLNTDSIFDVQVKRIHEYKRQLLNALNIIIIYNRIKSGLDQDMHPRTFLFGGKAAPGYKMAKQIIKLINNISGVVNKDKDVKDLLRVHFLPNYRVSLAEKIFPASDISEQISTAGTEASGTGNMKFMCNGALTLGTYDGANIEIAEEAGMDNIFLFGLNAEEVALEKSQYDPMSYYYNDLEIKQALDLIESGHFNFGEPGIFEDILASLKNPYDQYLHLADLRSYADTQTKAGLLYKDKGRWYEKAIMNVATSGKFSSDRTISQYAEEIWNVKSLRLKTDITPQNTIDEAKKQ